MKIFLWDFSIKRAGPPLSADAVLDMSTGEIELLRDRLVDVEETVETMRKVVESTRQKVYRNGKDDPLITEADPLLVKSEESLPSSIEQIKTGEPVNF